MATLKRADNKEMVITCMCGCDEGIRVKIDPSYGDYCYQTYISGNFYKEQCGIGQKLKKIWAIIKNKDFYYSEVIMTKEDFEEYRRWINEQ